MNRGVRGAVRRIARLEPGFVLLAAPFLLFPTISRPWTVVALVALLSIWLLRWFSTGRPGTLTPLDVPLLALLLMVPVAVWASAFPALTLPKLTGLILGVAAFRAVVNAASGPRSLRWVVGLFLLLGFGFTTFGLLGARWSSKLPSVQPALDRIPQLIGGLPGAETGINANQLAGTVLLILPVSLAVAAMRVSKGRWQDWLLRMMGLLLVVYLGVLLVLSQSRSAWVGVLAGLATLVFFRWRRTGWLILTATGLLALVVCLAGPTQLATSALGPRSATGGEDMLTTLSIEGRVELWSRALYAIQDFPFTGLGLGAFRQVVHILYPPFLVGPDTDIAHAHNVFLQVALDLGLPGLVAYLALVGTALWFAWRTARPFWTRTSSGSRRDAWLAAGIAGSLVAFHAYGLTDAIALGAKPGLALWMLLGMMAALWRTRRKRVRVPQWSEERQGMLARA